ncbi:polysaccharide pyruvyl transferase family protein [Butyrivibrio sp. XPD2002]|uniref:polysaccharide pyruvyl transferase family protein n=1 Tax=Butyrivibrio sp. XPD2002 TaxID=1280665 RepID=UPI0004225BD2|nr:polysaccharide pyruvyl transferase family protein [Butyrivibrio sp. XPD2002]
MKVGIMSMQRIINYGSFLQSYSLKKNLEMMGASVEMVDYHVEKPLVFHPKPIKKSALKKNKSRIEQALRNRLLFPHRLSNEVIDKNKELEKNIHSTYKKEMLPLLGVTEEKNYNPELDLLVIGSDEVFNCLQPNSAVGYSKELFGYNSKAKKIISYAASFGNTMKEGLEKYGIFNEISDMLHKLDGVSVRDKNSLSLVENMGCQDVQKNVDPVFLYDYEDETKIDVPESGYIVVYSYSFRIDQKESAAILRFAKKHNKKVICVEGYHPYLENYVALNPFEVLAYFKNADYIVTDTFHGTVFSIKYNKPFVSIVRGGTEGSYGNSEKLTDLLDTFSLKDRELKNLDELEEKLLTTIDYKTVNEKIADEKRKSLEYLKHFVCESN